MKTTVLLWAGAFMFAVLGAWYEYTPTRAEYVSSSPAYVTQFNTDSYTDDFPYDATHATMTDRGVSPRTESSTIPD